MKSLNRLITMKTKTAIPSQTPARNRCHFRPGGVFRSGLLACLIAIALLVHNNVAQAANGTWSGASSGAWLTAGNWNSIPGSASTTGNTDWALFGVAANATVGINMNTTVGVYYLGAIDYNNATARNIGDSSATAGVLTLNGTTLNSVANTIIYHHTTTLLTIQATQAGTMGLGLGNATDNIIQITSSGGVTISSIISGGSKNLTRQGAGSGVLTLSGANTYTGTTTISAGTLSLINASPFGTTAGVNGSSGISLAAGTTVRADTASGSTTTIAAPFTLAGAGDINLSIGQGGATTTFNLNGAIGGATGNLVFTTGTSSFGNFSSQFVLGAAGTYTGNTLITTGNGGNNPVFVKAATGVINALPVTTVLSFAGVAGGGTGRVFQYDLNGNNQTLAGLANTVASLRIQRVTSTAAATLTINNTADMSFGGSDLTTGSTTRAQIQGAIALTKNGAGTFTLGGTLAGGATAGGHTFTGDTKVLGGILVLGETIAIQNSAIDTANSITGNAANGLRTTVTTLTLGGLTGNKNLADIFTTTTGGYGSVTALTLNPGTGTTPSYSGIIADGASGMTLTKTGAGTQTLSGANSYSGSTTVTTGTLKLGANDVIPDGANKGNVTVTSTLDLNTFSETINGLSGAGTVNTVAGGTPTLTVGGNDQTSTFSGTILNTSGTLALTKTGTGTVTLSGTNSYSGVTTVNAGKLVVISTNASTGAVINNATLSVTASGTSQWLPATLTLANPCTLEFNSVRNPGTTSAPIRPGAAVGTVSGVTINVSSISGTAVVGNSYPLLGQVSVTNGYELATQPANITGHLAISSDTLVYVVETSPDVWVGADVTNPTWWDINTSLNWTGGAANNSPAGSYTQGDSVLFEDAFSPASPVTVEIRTAVTPGSVSFANSTKDYTVTTSGGFSIGGSGTLTKSGSGALTLNTPNSYSGGTTLSGGILTNANNSALGSGAVTIGTSAVRLVVNDGLTLTNTITINGGTGQSSRGLIENSGSANATLSGGTITINGAPSGGSHFASTASGSLTISKVINSAATAVGFQTGTGIFSGGGSYSSFIHYAGTLKLGAINGLSTSATVNIGNNGAANFDLAGYNQSLAGLAKGANAATIGNSLAASTATLTTTGNSSFAGIIADNFGSGGTVALTVNGGALTNTGVNTYSGGTTVTGSGTLQATVMTTVNALGTGAASVAAASTLILNNTNTTSTASAIANTITGAGLLKLQFAAGTTARDTTMPNVTGFSGNIRLANLGSTGDKWLAASLGTVTGSLTVDSGSTIYATTAPASFTGGITLNGAGNSEGRGAIRLGATTFGGNISLGSSSTINMEDATAAITGDISSGAVGTQTLTLGATGSTGGTLSGIIGGGTGIMNLAVAGAGTYTLSGQNTYTGGTTNSGAGGIIIANNAAALGTGPFTFTGGRRLVVNTGLNITNAITIAAGGGENSRGMLEAGTTAGTATISGPITFTTTSGAGGHMLAPAGTILHISGVITSTVPVSSRNGTVVLSGGGTGYTNFNLQQGTLQPGVANGIATTATVQLGGSSSGVFDLNGFNQSLVGLVKNANAGTITNTSQTTPAVLTLTGSTTTDFGGVIKDSGGAGKIGITINGGSATLSGTNTYTGSTTISGSGSLTLSLGGRITNSPVIDVQSGAQFIVTNVTGGFTLVANQTLKGNGLVDGQVNVAVGGILAPGASIGTLTMSTNPILGGTVQAEVNTANSPNADKLVISTGTLTYGGTLTVANLGAIPANGTVFDLFDAPAFAGGFSSVTLPSGGTLHWNTNGLTVDGSIAFTNTVPTATNILASRSSGLNFKIKRSLVLSNAADLDGDALTLTFASTTTNGAAITSDAEYIYLPTNNVADAFNYTVTDGFGGTNTAAVNIAIATGLNGQLATVFINGNLATATFYGVIGYAYNVERSTNSMSTWQVISNYPAGGVMTLNDDVSGLDPIPASAFYRLSVP